MKNKRAIDVDEWVENLTYWRVLWIGLKITSASMICLFVMGGCIGLPIWGLYKVFFEVMP